MASVTENIRLDVPADVVWALIRDVGAAAKAFPGVLTNSRLDGDVRTVTFAGGMVVREQIVDIDETARRVAYAVVGGAFSHHGASMQVIAEGDGCRFVWVSDFLPEETRPMVAGLAAQGVEALAGAAKAALAAA